MGHPEATSRAATVSRILRQIGERQASGGPGAAGAPGGAAWARCGSWRVGPALEAFGLLPEHAGRLLAELAEREGPGPPPGLTFNEELALAAGILKSWWRPVPADGAGPAPRVHVFVGGAGVGKTTCLGKYLAQTVLLEGRSACVWRLDGREANTAEWLSIYAEVLGVPVQREWCGEALPEREVHLVDMPGVDWRDPAAVFELAERVERLGPARVHLVLNAGYETRLLFDQVSAFRPLAVQDLVFTHLDEEIRRGKLWNLVLGTNAAIAFLSGGQNVPGDFQCAAPEHLLPGASRSNPNVCGGNGMGAATGKAPAEFPAADSPL